MAALLQRFRMGGYPEYNGLAGPLCTGDPPYHSADGMHPLPPWMREVASVAKTLAFTVPYLRDPSHITHGAVM